MNSSTKKWEELASQEQDDKLKAVTELLKDQGLEMIKPKALDQIVYTLSQGKKQRQQVLMIEGGVPQDKGENVKLFKKLAFEGPLKEVNPSTVNIEIEVKLGVGAPYIPITEVTDIYHEKPQTIQHKAG